MMDKVFMHKEHRGMWLWLAENPSKEKRDWPGWKCDDEYRRVQAGCYACQYGFKDCCGTDGCPELDECEFCGASCVGCPLIWPQNNYGLCRCDDEGGLWLLWEMSEDEDERRRLALQIANLPVKPGVITND